MIEKPEGYGPSRQKRPFCPCRGWERNITLPALMGSRVRRWFLIAATTGLAAFTSCEKHTTSELPEVQKEHIYPVVANEREPVASPGQTPSAKPTPADFFPDSGR